MFDLPGYIIHEKIHEDDRTMVFKGYATGRQMPVVIKVIKDKEADPVEIFRLINECEITRNLDIEGIIKPIRLEKKGKSLALVMKDIGAVSLREYTRGVPLDIPRFLDIAVQLAKTLGELHQNGIMHNNLKLENILVHADTGKVKIIDFRKAVFFAAKRKNAAMLSAMPENPGAIPLEEPERVEYTADYRKDYFSLGAVFYEMLTGQPPLQTEDPVEWRHLPAALYSIIMKLLSKIPDERYQSAYGLVKDLEECRRQWSLAGKIELSSAGRLDASPRFELPRRLYGRKLEAEAIRTAFARACGNDGEFILVSGYAGTGKTSLINQILKPIAVEKGFFAYGKFDQLRQNIPYAPFAAALGSVIRQLMTGSREKLEIWRKKILRALGPGGSIITGLIPELEMITGYQQPVEELQPREAQNRFFMVFSNFIKVFATKEHPLVIFLDDLQWADLASLQLIRYLCMDTGLNCMLLVGAYRDNEVAEEHPLSTVIEEISNDGVTVRQIHLAPFNRTETREFIAGALRCSGDKVDALAGTLYRKTYGIPFFLAQLLKAVYDDRLIVFNMLKGCWEWEAESIQRLRMSDDIAGLILEKLKKLHEETRDVLKLASCIGNTFDLKTLATICERTQFETASLLLPAVREGLVLPVTQAGKDLPASYHGPLTVTYEFLHDMVRQAVYSLLPEEEKKKAHVKAGRLILRNTAHDGLGSEMLSILDHINRGLDLINDPEERLQLAGCNLTAGRKAKASAAYGSAVNCFKAGLELLPDDSWDNCYDLCYNLYLERAQCEYLTGDVETAELLFDVIISRVGTELERADVYGLKMELYAGTGKYHEAVQIGINALKNLGMKLPANPGMLDNARELLVYKWRMRNKSVTDLAELPEMKNPVQKKVAQLLIELILATCTSHPDLYAFTIIKAGNHAIKYGNTDMASIGFLGYSITEGSVLGNYAAGHEIGKVAIALVERFGNSTSKCIVYFTFGSLISHWTHHGKEGFEYLYKAAQYAIEAGNVLLAGYSYGVILETGYLTGKALDEVLEEARKCNSYARKMKHENLAINAAVYEWLASALTGRAGCLTLSGAGGYNEEDFIKSAKGDKASLAAYYFSKIQLCYMFGYYRDALSEVEKIKTCASAILGFMLSAEYIFYHSLVIAALYDELPLKARLGFRRILKKNQWKMKKWSDSCPANFLHKYLLVEAETARISDNKLKAGELYDQAIRSAHENGYVHIEALACELAAKFYGADNRERIAKAYINDAIHLYREWGAVAKAQDLERRYPALLEEVAKGKKAKEIYDSAEIIKSLFQSHGSRTSGLHMRAIKKVIRNISEQSAPDKLFENLLELAVESTDSNKGYLILEKDDELFIESIRDSKNSHIAVVKPIPLEKSINLSRLVVRYVTGTFEPVVINNCKEAGIFARDPYIAKSGIKAIACVPLQLRGISVGVLYLENSLITGIFTEDRVKLLKLLADQMINTRTMQVFLEHSSSKMKVETWLPPAEALTGREMEVLSLMAAGLLNIDIAAKLDMTVNTVKIHIKNIYEKLQVNRRVQAVAMAKELDIL